MADAAGAAISGYLAGQQSSLLEEERQKRNARDEAVKAKAGRIKEERAAMTAPGYLGSQRAGVFAAQEPEAFTQSQGAMQANQDAAWEQLKSGLQNRVRSIEGLQGEELNQALQETFALVGGSKQFGPEADEVLDNFSRLSQNDPQQGLTALKGVLDMEEGAKDTARQQKIDGLEARGLSKADATDVVDRNFKFITDPLSGETSRRSLVTGGEAPEGAPEAAPPTPAPTGEAPTTLFDQIDSGVGIGAIFTELKGKTIGQVVPSAVDPEVVRARTAFRGINEKIVRALATSGRPLAIEHKNLSQLIDALGALSSKEGVRASLTEVHAMLSRQVVDDIAYSKDSSNPKKVRIESAERAKNLQDALREIGTPPAQNIAPPQAAVDMLMSDHSLAKQFDAKFGPGTARGILGG